MRYFYLILFFLVLGYFVLFSFLNDDLIKIDLYFLHIQGITIGFSLLGALTLGMVISFLLQIPLFFKKRKKYLKQMTIKINKKQIIVGLDCDTEEEVETILTLLDPNLYRVKVGKQLFMNCGPNIIEKINNFGFEIFLDLKLHDIPNTVSKALQNILKLNIWMTNIHLSGGREMIEASVNKIKEFNNETLLVGVTVLTSLDDKNIEEIGFYRNTEESTLVLAKLGKEIGIDGVVASLNSVSEIKTTFGNDFVTVTPGIRMQQNDEDQKRSGSLFDAIQFGTNFVVVGRELTQAKIRQK